MYKSSFFQNKNWRLVSATSLVLVASFSVIMTVLLISANLHHILTLWGESQEVSVYFQEDATPESQNQIEGFLKSQSKIDKITVVDKDLALAQFREQMATYAPDLLKDAELLKYIPKSIQFSLAKSVAAEDQASVLHDFATGLKVMPGVEEVSYGQDWIANYGQIMAALGTGGVLLILTIMLCSGFVISNSIQNSIHVRRTEIEVLELVGATAWMIRRPFLREAFWISVISFFSSLAVVFLAFLAARDALKQKLSFLQVAHSLQFIPVSWLAIVALFSVLVGVLSAWFCVRKINTGWASAAQTNA